MTSEDDQDDVELREVEHGDQVGIYEAGHTSTLITCRADDLVQDPDAEAGLD